MRDRFARIGNNLSADFANTVVSFEYDGGSLHSAADVFDFLLVSGALETSAAMRGRRALSDVEGQRFLASSLTLRTAVTKALLAIERKKPLDDASLTTINDVLAADEGHERIERLRGTSYELTRRHTNAGPETALVPIARDIARLLVTPEVPVRQCAGVDCVRHFYDDSRTGRRRWCDMAICGNRAKAAAFSARRATA